MTNKTSEIPTPTRITVLKHTIGGRDTAFISTVTHLTTEQVRQIQQSHGYPDKAKMEWAIDVLDKKVNEIPEGPTEADKAAEAAARAERSAALVARHPANGGQGSLPPPPQVVTKPDELRVVLNTAKGSESKRVQALANRIIDDFDRLKQLLQAEQAKVAEKQRREAERAAEKARREQERAAAKAEVERLEAQLREARAKLRTGPNSPNTPGGVARAAKHGTGPQLQEVRRRTAALFDSHGVTAKDIRGWAQANGVDCPKTGMLPTRVLDAYEQAHPKQVAS